MKDERFTNKQIVDIAYNVGKPVFKYFNKKMERELSKLSIKPIHASDFINVIIITLCNITSNKFTHINEFFKNKKGYLIDNKKLINSFMENLMAMLHEEENKELKEKMN